MKNSRKAGITLSYAYTVLNMLTGLFVSSFVLRVLGDFEYGLYQTITAFISYLVMLEFGMGTVMHRNLLVARTSGDLEKTKKVTASLWSLTIFMSIIISIVGIAFYFCIDNIYAGTIPAENMHYAKLMFLILLVDLLASFLSQTLTGTFIGYENYTMGNTIKLARLVIRTVLLVVLLLLYKSALALVILDTAISVVLFLFLLVYVKRKYNFCFSVKYFDKAILKECWPMCFALMLQTIVTQANSTVDKFFISIKMDMESVSLYSVPLYIYSVFTTFSMIPSTMYMPKVVKDIQSGMSGRELEKSFIPAGRLVAIVGGTILFGFVAVGRPFISIVYGEKYLRAWLIALIAIIPVFVNSTGSCSMLNVLDALNLRQVRSYFLIATTAINIVLTYFLIDIWGILGAVIATAFSMVLGQLTLLNIYYKVKLKINVWRLYWNSYKGIVAAEIIACGIGFWVAGLFKNPFLAFFVGGIVFVLTEFSAFMLFGLNKKERGSILAILNRFLPKR